MTRRAVLLLLAVLAVALSAGPAGCRHGRDGWVRHRTACGPHAVSAVVHRLCLPAVEPAEVSRHITRPGPGQAVRELLSVVSIEAASITWPGELEAALRRHGVAFERFDGTHAELAAEAARIERLDGTGILLLRDRGGPASFHYLAFPPVADCAAYYGKRTTFVRLWRCRRGRD